MGRRGPSIPNHQHNQSLSSGSRAQRPLLRRTSSENTICTSILHSSRSQRIVYLDSTLREATEMAGVTNSNDEPILFQVNGRRLFGFYPLTLVSSSREIILATTRFPPSAGVSLLYSTTSVLAQGPRAKPLIERLIDRQPSNDERVVSFGWFTSFTYCLVRWTKS
jgi:hypothetical protein